MKSLQSLLYSLVISTMLPVFGIIGLSTLSPEDNSELVVIDYQIQETSVLEVNGKTNINSFCCTSKDNYKKKKLKYAIEGDNSKIVFNEARLSLNTNNLDCGKKAINKDMRKTLQADKYPQIILELKEIQNTKCYDFENCEEWYEITAITDITITCFTQTYIFPVIVKKLDNHNFRVSGEATLQLCDFEIEPPTALLGLVKVKDGLDIAFDLYIELA